MNQFPDAFYAPAYGCTHLLGPLDFSLYPCTVVQRELSEISFPSNKSLFIYSFMYALNQFIDTLCWELGI